MKKIKATPAQDGNMNFTELSYSELSRSLVKWYAENQRVLPWRASRDPYRIWISEVMLQQTTVQAVIPFYDRFMERFPSVQELAEARIEHVLEAWAGLGYYSRARNLHKSAQILFQQGFAKTAEELIELPGFGPYTSRAVSSLAFGEKVGVLDGNVIRILSRVNGAKIPWWKTEARQILQNISDELCQSQPSEIVNQAMMELGATLCTPTKPHCFRCPWLGQCLAQKKGLQENLPLAKPRRTPEIWIWEPQVLVKNKKLAFIENDYAPFLKGHLILPGLAKKSDKKPTKYEATHSITHHQIFIRPSKLKPGAKTKLNKKKLQWIPLAEVKQKSPSSLIQKALKLSALLILLVHISGCKSHDKIPFHEAKQESMPTSTLAKTPPEEIHFGSRLTSGGENFHARFSGDGLSLIYVSKRSAHKNQQIYTWSLSESKERRLTFSDGDADFPLFVREGSQDPQKIAYVSSTDAAKEKPHLFSGIPKAPFNDLFVSGVEGLPIEKLTKLNQVFTSLDEDGKAHFIFSLNQAGNHQIGSVDIKGGSPRILTQSKDRDLLFALENKSQLVVWLEEDKVQPAILKEKRASGKVQDHPLPFISIHDLNWWDPERETLLVSGKLPKDQLDSVYLFDLRYDCLIQLAATTTDLWYPSADPSRSRLAITLLDNGLRQIYLYTLPIDLGQCLPAPAPAAAASAAIN